MRRSILLAPLSVLAACTTTPRPPVIQSLPAVEVTARGETEPVGTAAQDAADDPAIWRNAANPAASLIVATDKKAGLYLYGMDGKPRHFSPDGRLNNVDLIEMPGKGVIVVASDRNDPLHALLRIYRLDTDAERLVPLGTVSGGAGEAYGVCLTARDARVHAFSVLKHGRVEEIAIDLSGAQPVGLPVRQVQLQTQTEGCVVDPRDRTLYVGEEDRGIWRFADGASVGTLIAPADGKQLVADVEGLAIMPQGERDGWIVASSQGDNAYAVYRLPDMTPAGRVRIVAGRVGATEETDGIALAAGGFGGDFPDGLLVVQDGMNAPSAQNFKLVSWRDVVDALRPR